MIEGKIVSGITLARGGSKTIPNKNLVVINGRSLLRRAVECGVKSKYIDAHFVSSDSATILQEAGKYGGHPILRPEEFAGDTASSAAAIEHALEFLRLDTSYIVEIMCTSPFKTVEDVDAVIEKLHRTGADSVVAVCRVYDHHPARLKYIVDDMLVNFFPEKKESRRQDLEPAAYVRNGAIYAFTVEAFRKYKSRYGGITRPYIMPEERSINIDEPMDLTMAQIIGEKYGL